MCSSATTPVLSRLCASKHRSKYIDQNPGFVICKAEVCLLCMKRDTGTRDQAHSIEGSLVTLLRPREYCHGSGHSAHANQKSRIVPLYTETLSPGMILAPALYRLLFSSIKAYAMRLI